MDSKRRDNKGRVLRTGESQRSDGKYMYRYTAHNGERKTVYSWKLVDTDKVPNGKKCTHSLRNLEKAIQKDIDDGIRVSDANRITLNDQFEQFVNIRSDLRQTTICNYKELYDKHIRDTIGCNKISSVKHSHVMKIYMDMYNEGLKPSSIEKIHTIVYQVFESAVLDNIIRTNPASNAFTKIRKQYGTASEKRHALTEEEQDALVGYIYSSKKYKSWRSFFTIMLGTGMRIGEALGLRWDDCDFENGVISVNHELLYKTTIGSGYHFMISKPKTEAGVRTIPMLDDVKEALMYQRSIRIRQDLEPFVVDGFTNFIFLNSNGRVHVPSYVYDVIQSIVKSYNRDEISKAYQENRDPILLPKFSAHILRHTFCTRFCENERNIKVVQEIMGHKDSRTTMDVYNEATMSKKRESIDNLNGKIRIS